MAINQCEPTISFVFDVIKTAKISVVTGPATTELTVGFLDERVQKWCPMFQAGHVVMIKQTTGMSMRELHVPLELMEIVNEMKLLTVTTEEEVQNLLKELTYGASWAIEPPIG